MRKLSRLIRFFLAIVLVLNNNLVFAATDNASYNAGYKIGYEYGAKNVGNGIDGDDIYDDFYRSKEYYEIIRSIENFRESEFEEGFFDGFRDGVKDNTKVDYASELGKLLGEIYGFRDYQSGIDSDWEDAIPSNREIRKMFDLQAQSSDYRDTFIQVFEEAFKEYYIIGYEKAMFEPIKITMEQGVEDGEEIGAIFGAAYGAKDYYEGKDSDYTRNLPSDRVIISEYSLNNDSDEYKDGFLSGFIWAYEEAYNQAYRDANVNDTLRNEESAYSDGQVVGITAGLMQATVDYMSRLTNDWRRSLPSDRFIISEFNLLVQSSNYRDAFISGYYDGYSAGYNAKFKELSQRDGTEKLISEVIPISGGNISSLDNNFTVTIMPGTYYHDINLSINTTYDVANQQASKLIKASDSYKVSILNTSGNLVDEKPIEISFEYYGDRLKGGIYRLVDGRWTYIPTVIEDGYLTAYIKPSSINSLGSTFSAFMDPNAIVFTDARGHWAKDEINTYLRRNIINGYSDMTFKPERNISRAEFLAILSRVYKWNLPTYTENTLAFKDYNTFGNFNNIISYSLNYGYIKGYEDGTFKPANPITYKEIENIMNRVLGNNTFKWSDIAFDILYSKKVRSNSFDDMNNKITRAEVVYMLYTITEK